MRVSSRCAVGLLWLVNHIDAFGGSYWLPLKGMGDPGAYSPGSPIQGVLSHLVAVGNRKIKYGRGKMKHKKPIAFLSCISMALMSTALVSTPIADADDLQVGLVPDSTLAECIANAEYKWTNTLPDWQMYGITLQAISLHLKMLLDLLVLIAMVWAISKELTIYDSMQPQSVAVRQVLTSLLVS